MAGLANPSAPPTACCASASIPANTGQATLVPPIRLSENANVFPSGCRTVWPTRMPVLGSASADTSGITRIGVELVVPSGSAVARLFGTMPAWYDGCAYVVLTPPPPDPPYPAGYLPGGVYCHFLPPLAVCTSGSLMVPHEVSHW